MNAGAQARSFHVLADPNRRKIMELLRVRARPVGALVEELPLTQPAVSKHLRVLRDAGLVNSRVDAQRRLYSVRAEGLRSLDAWLRPYRRLWEARLDSLEHHLETMAKAERASGAETAPRRRGGS